MELSASVENGASVAETHFTGIYPNSKSGAVEHGKVCNTLNWRFSVIQRKSGKIGLYRDFGGWHRLEYNFELPKNG